MHLPRDCCASLPVRPEGFHLDPTPNHIVHGIRSQPEISLLASLVRELGGQEQRSELRELSGKTAEDIDFIIQKIRKDFLKTKKPAIQ